MTTVIKLAHGEVVFLGQDEVNQAFYFFVNKAGGGRFLRFLDRPVWCIATGMGNVIKVDAELPSEVLSDVTKLLEGTYDYAAAPKLRKVQDRPKQTEIQLKDESWDKPTSSATNIGASSPSSEGEVVGGIRFTSSVHTEPAPRAVGSDPVFSSISPGPMESGDSGDSQPKKRGRPVGSVNKAQQDSIMNLIVEGEANEKKRRGRPPGSKNKPKEVVAEAIQPTLL